MTSEEILSHLLGIKAEREIKVGADIHLYVEKEKSNGWKFIPPPGKPIWYIECKGILVVWRNKEDLHRIFENGMEDGVYAYINDWNVVRDYGLFAKLAGVRSYGDEVQIVEPRGMPHHASEEYDYISDRWDCDGHSHSYFYLNELIKHFDKQDDRFDYFYINVIKPMIEMSEDKNYIDMRIVFFFDN